MGRFFLIKETKYFGTHLIKDVEFNTYDDVIKNIHRYLNATDIIYIVELVGKAYGEMKNENTIRKTNN